MGTVPVSGSERADCAGMNIEWEQWAQRIFPHPTKAGVEKRPRVSLKKFGARGRETKELSSYME